MGKPRQMGQNFPTASEKVILANLHVFARVVAAGSLTAAGNLLGMSKPTVSKHITALERHVGARLLHRTTRPTRPTTIGALFYAHCQVIMNELKAAQTEVLRASTEPRGSLRITAPTCFGADHLTPTLGDFFERYPEITVDLTLSNRVVDVIARGFDVAIRVARAAPPGLLSRRLAPCVHLVCGAPKYLERRGIPGEPSDLANHHCLTYAYYATGNSWRLEGPRGPETVTVTGRFQANSGAALRAALLNGFGVGLVPTYLVWKDLAAGRLRDVLPGYRDNGYAIFAVYPDNDHVTPKVQVFVDYLQSRFRQPPYWDRAAGI